ncbi:MAG: hypothetical protein ACTSW1_19045 [Candidatus Hodarchaeales archaeon]
MEETIGMVSLGIKAGEMLAKIKEIYSRRKKKSGEESIGYIVVLEVGRPILDAVTKQLGTPVATISVKKTVKTEEIPGLAGDVYKALKKVQDTVEGEQMTLVLSGMVVLAFQIGQLVGLSHFNLNLAFWQEGKYEIIPAANRELMF